MWRSADKEYPRDWSTLLEERGDPDPWENPATKPEALTQDSVGLLHWARSIEAKIPFWLSQSMWTPGFTQTRALWAHRRGQAIRIRAKIQALPVSAAAVRPLSPPSTVRKRSITEEEGIWETPFQNHGKGSPPLKKRRCTPPGSPTYSDLTSTADVIYAADEPLKVTTSPPPGLSPPASPSDAVFSIEGSKEHPIIID